MHPSVLLLPPVTSIQLLWSDPRRRGAQASSVEGRQVLRASAKATHQQELSLWGQVFQEWRLSPCQYLWEGHNTTPTSPVSGDQSGAACDASSAPKPGLLSAAPLTSSLNPEFPQPSTSMYVNVNQPVLLQTVRAQVYNPLMEARDLTLLPAEGHIGSDTGTGTEPVNQDLRLRGGPYSTVPSSQGGCGHQRWR